MGILARTSRPVAVFGGLALIASCGSDPPPNGSVGAGVPASSGTSSSGGGSTGSGGPAGGTSSSGSGAGGNGGTGASSGAGILLGDGGGGPDAGGMQTGQQCLGINSSRTCCINGTQTCVNSGGEFAIWGPCIDPSGAAASCTPPTPVVDAGCGNLNEGPSSSCDAGFDAGPPPKPPALCTDMAISTEPEILVGYSPAVGQTVGQHGQIKVWVNDENPPFVAPGEQIDPQTGQITAAGNRIAAAPDGLLWEPALYIAPQTPQNGGTPHFPQWVKGWYSNTPPSVTKGFQVPGMDPVPPGIKLQEKYTGEDIWDVASLGLAPGTYTAVFVIHDGDDDRAIGCVNIVITP
ncbi:MAG: hypothetical protein M3O46_20620 [Myxococcota bacterium]|nr:hypothetical protein [Myxococcota bacterium]